MMFGIGFSEIILIGLIFIIFIRPDDLPKFFRTIGKFYGKFKKSYDEVMAVKNKILKEINETAALAEKAVTLDEKPPPLPPPKESPAVPAGNETKAGLSADSEK
jgi:sec-independent protein translocase protein TatB